MILCYDKSVPMKNVICPKLALIAPLCYPVDSISKAYSTACVQYARTRQPYSILGAQAVE